MEVAGPPWLMITIAVISFLGVVVTAVVGPVVVERLKRGGPTPEPEVSAPSAIVQRASDGVALIQSAIVDLQARVGRLEAQQTKGGS